MSNRKTLDERIAAAKEEATQKEARVKELLQQLKVQDRKDRNHRLCKRGGIVEKLLPDLIRLTDDQFDVFVQKTLLSGFAEKILRGLVPPAPEPSIESDGSDVSANNGDETAGTITIAEERADEAYDPKTTETMHKANATSKAQTGETLRAAG